MWRNMREKKLFAETVGQWDETVRNFYHFSPRDWILPLREDNLICTEKKEHLNVQVDFQDFFIQFKKKKWKESQAAV